MHPDDDPNEKNAENALTRLRVRPPNDDASSHASSKVDLVLDQVKASNETVFSKLWFLQHAKVMLQQLLEYISQYNCPLSGIVLPYQSLSSPFCVTYCFHGEAALSTQSGVHFVSQFSFRDRQCTTTVHIRMLSRFSLCQS